MKRIGTKKKNTNWHPIFAISLESQICLQIVWLGGGGVANSKNKIVYQFNLPITVHPKLMYK
jgi:hypothetical protein